MREIIGALCATAASGTVFGMLLGVWLLPRYGESGISVAICVSIGVWCIGVGFAISRAFRRAPAR